MLFAGKKNISGVLKKNDSSLLGLYSDEPRTVPPSPGHNTQLGTSDVTWEYTKLLIDRNSKEKKSFILKIYYSSIIEARRVLDISEPDING